MRKKKILDPIEDDIYTEEGVEAQLEDGEIEDWEAGFMQGYENA
tara:strand:- start:1469 stop:1600 length:132 start_codon:yes stop_codon:yes gene_type:complete